VNRSTSRALTDQAIAAYDYQLAAHRENVLSGFQQVEDDLAAVRIWKTKPRSRMKQSWRPSVY